MGLGEAGVGVVVEVSEVVVVVIVVDEEEGALVSRNSRAQRNFLTIRVAVTFYVAKNCFVQ